jgi:hypothetical protein
MTNGQLAYEAYCSQFDWALGWQVLPLDEQAKWEHVAVAVMQSLVGKPVSLRDNGTHKAGQVQYVSGNGISVIVF